MDFRGLIRSSISVRLWLLPLWLCCCFSIAQAEAQTTGTWNFPLKVTFRPAGAPADDAVRVWGGIQAGPNGNTQVVDKDGNITGAITITDGTLTFAKWAQNGCADGEVPTWDAGGTAWVCGAGGGSGTFDPSDDQTITGTYTFTTWPVIGSTPADTFAGLHIHKSSSQGAIRLERGDTGTAFDIVADTDFHLASKNGGDFFTTDGSGSGTIGPGGGTWQFLGSLRVDGDLIPNGRVYNHLLPKFADTYDLGSGNYPWRRANITTLSSTVFAESTQQLLGGWLTIPPNAGSLGAGLASGSGTVNFGVSGLCSGTCPGKFILIRGHDTSGTLRTEYFELQATGLGTTYTVLRDRSNENAGNGWTWAKGTPWMFQGALGQGRIDFNAQDTPRISILTQGATYNATTEKLRIGYLDGFPGASAGTFGIAIGSGANRLLYDGTTMMLAGDGSGITSINGGQITTGSITADRIQTNSLTATQIAAGAITASEIAADAVTASAIAAGAVTASAIAADAVGANAILAGAVTAGKINVVDLAAVSATMGALTVNNTLTMNSSGTLKSSGMTGPSGTGFWLDYNGGLPRFYIGHSSGQHLSWNGSSLVIRGQNMTLDGNLFTDNIYNATSSMNVGVTSAGASLNLMAGVGGNVTFANDPVPTTTDVRYLGSASRRWAGAYFDLEDQTGSAPVVINSSGHIGYTPGLTRDVVIAGCTMTFQGGILTAVSGSCGP